MQHRCNMRNDSKIHRLRHRLDRTDVMAAKISIIRCRTDETGRQAA